MTITACRNDGNVRDVSISTLVGNDAATCGSAVRLVALGVVPVVVCSTEFVGVSGPRPSEEPRSQRFSGSPAGASAAPMPTTRSPFQLPARLFQNTLLNNLGELKRGADVGRVACNCALFSAVDRPAGAGRPVLVTAV